MGVQGVVRQQTTDDSLQEEQVAARYEQASLGGVVWLCAESTVGSLWGGGQVAMS